MRGSTNSIHFKQYLKSHHITNPELPEMASMIPVPKVSCILQIKMIVKPGHREAWLAHFKQIFHHVSQEPECAYFIIGEDEPGVFRWTEGWTKDKEWINDVLLSSPSKS
jgi:hypothetical protein